MTILNVYKIEFIFKIIFKEVSAHLDKMTAQKVAEWHDGETINVLYKINNNTIDSLNRERNSPRKQKVEIKKKNNKIYIGTVSMKKDNTPHNYHFFEAPTPLINGDKLEWCDVVIPGCTNHYSSRKNKRGLVIIDADYFNRLIRDL